MSVRQQIVTKLDSNFKLITPGNGYSFDIKNMVFEWRDNPLADSELPAIIHRDVFDSVSDQDEGEHELTVEVVIFAVGGTSPATIRAMIVDVLNNFKLIAQENYVAGATFINSEMEVEYTKKKYAGAVLTFTISYHTAIWGT